MRYRGTHPVILDNKGRLSLPEEYTSQTADEWWVVTIDPKERCLLLYPIDEWESFEDNFESSLWSNSRHLQRLLIGHAEEVALDRHGRFTLPPLLQEYAGIEDQAVIVGQGRRCELWEAEHWYRKRDAWLASLQREHTPDDVDSATL